MDVTGLANQARTLFPEYFMYNKQDMVIAAIGKQDFLFFFNESRINILIDFLYLKINPNDLLEGL